MLCIIKETFSLLKDQLQLHQLTVAALQALTVSIDLNQLALQLIQLGLAKTNTEVLHANPDWYSLQSHNM